MYQIWNKVSKCFEQNIFETYNECLLNQFKEVIKGHYEEPTKEDLEIIKQYENAIKEENYGYMAFIISGFDYEVLNIKALCPKCKKEISYKEKQFYICKNCNENFFEFELYKIDQGK